MGKTVVKKLKEENIDFVSLSLKNSVDFRNFEQTKGIFEKEKFDAVINCAAFVGGIQVGYERPGELFYNNTLIATNLMEAARLANVKRFVNPISNCVYPQHLETLEEKDLWSGVIHESVLAYATARKSSWVQGWAYYKQYGFDSVHVILSNMYGPGDYFDEVQSHALGALVKKFVDAKKTGETQVTVWGTGKPIREWLYVEDGAEALVRALYIAPHIEPINVGRSEGVSILELAKMIEKAVGYEGNIVLDTSKPDGVPSKVMVAEKMKHIFQWAPPTSLQEGIKKTIEWYENNLLGNGSIIEYEKRG